MKKSINVIAMFVVASAICLAIVQRAIAQTGYCVTTPITNENAVLKDVTTELCGVCSWKTIAVGWQPGDGAGGKWVHHNASVYASVQECKSGSGTCISVLMAGVINCPPDDEDPEEGLVDTDGDGVYDFEDDCPTIPGLASNFGCP